MGWVKTQEEVELEKENYFNYAMNILGDTVILENRIKFRKTPHTPSKYIYTIEKEKGLQYYGEAKDTILQVLRRMINKTK